MQQLLCEPEDRIGSQASTSVSRPNSMVVQARRSGFMTVSGASAGVDGAELIKVCSILIGEINLIKKSPRLTLSSEASTG